MLSNSDAAWSASREEKPRVSYKLVSIQAPHTSVKALWSTDDHHHGGTCGVPASYAVIERPVLEFGAGQVTHGIRSDGRSTTSWVSSRI